MAKKVNDSRLPDRIFESSWEVCNKVGGIHTVLSTHAKQLKALYGEALCYLGPDLGNKPGNAEFNEISGPLDEWCTYARQHDKLQIRCGRWNIPGEPLVILVDFKKYYTFKDHIYSQFWEWFGIDSIQAYGDYDEACMFAYACGEVIRSWQRYHLEQEPAVVAHFHEWTTGLGLLYVKKHLPAVATVFTTHATSIGRSISGNGKKLYGYMEGYQGDQMARELNMVAKHSVEKTAAAQADCFTTVSGITACECAQLLDKAPDLVTPNGFEDDFVPRGAVAIAKRKAARRLMLEVAESVLGYSLEKNVLMLATSGRYEFRNKGLDVFIESLHQLRHDQSLDRQILAYILVPGDVSAARQEVLERLEALRKIKPASSRAKPEPAQKAQQEAMPDAMREAGPIYHPFNTHWLNHIEQDKVLNSIKYLGFTNGPDEKVKIIFVPCYLHGHDGIFNKSYYDILQAFDLTAFMSYYEPWGYTPLESLAFSVPTLTTSLSGFGLWLQNQGYKSIDIRQGAAVIPRDDSNYAEVVKQTARVFADFAALHREERRQVRQKAGRLSKQALWSKFIGYYQQAYQLASNRAKQRSTK
ncbi:MAG: glycogen/starch synthase [Bacteroidales bacterium]|nr:glycogen/starch synthase [Bacteroidales bacterium]MDD4431224.1 glycogen/starch synthase [Bacteroidales bacterium]